VEQPKEESGKPQAAAEPVTLGLLDAELPDLLSPFETYADGVEVDAAVLDRVREDPDLRALLYNVRLASTRRQAELDAREAALTEKLEAFARERAQERQLQERSHTDFKAATEAVFKDDGQEIKVPDLREDPEGYVRAVAQREAQALVRAALGGLGKSYAEKAEEQLQQTRRAEAEAVQASKLAAVERWQKSDPEIGKLLAVPEFFEELAGLVKATGKDAPELYGKLVHGWRHRLSEKESRAEASERLSAASLAGRRERTSAARIDPDSAPYEDLKKAIANAPPGSAATKDLLSRSRLIPR